MGGLWGLAAQAFTVQQINQRTKERREADNDFEANKAAEASRAQGVKDKIALDKKNKGLLAASRKGNAEGLGGEFGNTDVGTDVQSLLSDEENEKKKQLLNPLAP